jgi:hypothetical protein
MDVACGLFRGFALDGETKRLTTLGRPSVELRCLSEYWA